MSSNQRTYKIKGNPDYLLGKSAQLNDIAGRIERDLRQFEDTINPLRSTFLGQRANSFFQQFDQFRGQMYGMRDIARALAGQLAEAARRLKAVDGRR